MNLPDTQTSALAESRGGALRFTHPSGSRPLDGYTIKRGVGRGGFGEVYYATSDGGKEVALKLVRRNLEIELRGAGQCLNLKHAHLISLYDIKQDERGDYWVVMEFVRGESLEQIIAAHPRGLPVAEALGYLRGIAAGVGYLHDRGIVHRDLKPGNIFLDEGILKIGDYGLSKFISASRRSGQTESIGTVHYMAPEVANGRYGKEIDLYALGVIFYEMLTGRVPYDGESIGEVLMKHLTAQPELCDIAEPYRSVVAKLLAKNPADRYPSVQAVLDDLDGKRAESCEAQAIAAQPISDKGSQPTCQPAQPLVCSPAKQPERRQLTCSKRDAVVEGVCSGFARYFGIDPLWIRLPVLLIGVLTSFLPVIILYFVLAWLMPDDPEEEEQTRAAGLHLDPDGPSLGIDRAWLIDVFTGLLRLAVAVVFGVGVGLVVGGLSLAQLGYRSDAPNVLGPGAGFLTAGVIGYLLLRGFPYRTGFVRVLLGLLFGAGVGNLLAGAVLVMAGDDELAAWLGVGGGFLTAGLATCLLFWSLPRTLWRLLPPVELGVGIGHLTVGAALALLGPRHDAPYIVGPGAGFLFCGAVACLLLLGPKRARAGEPAGAEGTLERIQGRPRGWVTALVVLTTLVGGAVLVGFALSGPPGYRVSDSYSPHPGWNGPWGSNGAWSDMAMDGALPQLSCQHQASLGSRGTAECRRAATVQLVIDERSVQGNVPGAGFREVPLCDVHARQEAWKAKQSNYSFTILDLETGSRRMDLELGL